MPYKWGGFDSLKSFESGIKQGRAAGDLYNSEKRRKADAAVSSQAVGIDCSGFISRCWKLPSKQGTQTLKKLCRKLDRADQLKPGDILNAAGGHVILFAHWVDASQTKAIFYEAEPFSKVRANEYPVQSLIDSGFEPLRYLQIRD
jgi:hypothetical protein